MPTPFSALLLCGGLSSRMGSDKAFLDYQGIPLWKHQLQKLQSLAPSEIFISRRSSQTPIPSNEKTIIDSYTETGPLAGIYEGLQQCTTSHLLVLAIDLPLLESSSLKTLLPSSLRSPGIVYQSGNNLEPLAACYPQSLLQEINHAIQNQNLSLQKLIPEWIHQNKMTSLSISESLQKQFLNWNTPQSLGEIFTEE